MQTCDTVCKILYLLVWFCSKQLELQEDSEKSRRTPTFKIRERLMTAICSKKEWNETNVGTFWEIGIYPSQNIG